MRHGTRPSLGPSTRARWSSLCIVRVKPAVAGRSWRHRGWANLRKWDEPAPGFSRRTSRGSPLSTALAREKACWVRKGRWSRPSSLRGHESRKVWLPAHRKQLQKSSGGVWSRISSAYALQKQRQGRVNGDLARSERRWVKPSSGTASERSVGVPDWFPSERERTGRDPGWRESAIQRSAHRPKGGVSVAGPGL